MTAEDTHRCAQCAEMERQVRELQERLEKIRKNVQIERRVSRRLQARIDDIYFRAERDIL